MSSVVFLSPHAIKKISMSFLGQKLSVEQRQI